MTAIRVEEPDRRIIIWRKYDLEVVRHDRPGERVAAHQEPDGRAAQCSA
jgi:hypothetical protein